MYNNQPEYGITHKTELVNQQCSEELLAAREEIKFLRELIDSQKSLIRNLENELLEANQELEIINEELGRTVMSGVSFDEAKAIAKQLFNDEQLGTVLVENLLNIIYNSSVEPTEFKETAELSLKINKVENKVTKKVIEQSNKVRQHSKELRHKYTELCCQWMIFTAHLNSIKQQLNTLPPPLTRVGFLHLPQGKTRKTGGKVDKEVLMGE